MKKFIKWVVASIGIILLLPIAAFVGYFISEIQPRIVDIDLILTEAGQENLNPSQRIKDIILVSVNSENKPSGAVARTLASIYQRNDAGVIRNWQLQWLAWHAFVESYYSQNEVFALFCATVYNGDGQGLNELAIRRYNRPLSKLSESEAAEIVAYTRAPSYMGRSRERLERMRDLLLERVQKRQYNNSHHSPT